MKMIDVRATFRPDDLDDDCKLYVADRRTGEPRFWIKHEPRVYLVGSTSLEWFGDHGLNSFFEHEELSQMPISDSSEKSYLVELAGRLCYYSSRDPRPGGHTAYIRHILSEGHGSVLEHAHFNFIITGVSRAFSNEMVRHRLASCSQLSQRHFDEVECAFVCPPRTLRNARLFDRWIATMEACHDNYVAQVEDMKSGDDFHPLAGTDKRKAILGEALSQLPNAIETKLMLSCNARCLRGILDQRGVAAADQEIRRVAVKLHELARLECPSLFDDYTRAETAAYGTCIATLHRKV